MFKQVIIILLFPVCVWANPDCQWTQSMDQIAISCHGIHLVIDHEATQDVLRIEFPDGFTLFFYTGTEQPLHLAMGRRQQDQLSRSDYEQMVQLLEMADEIEPLGSSLNLLKSLNPNSSITSNNLFGGEVPWPSDGNDDDNKKQKIKGND